MDLDFVSVRATLSYRYLALVHGCLVISLLAWCGTSSSGIRTVLSIMHIERSENGRLATSQLAACSLLAVSLGRAFGNHLQHEATRLDSPAGSVPPPIPLFPIVFDFTDLATKHSKTTSARFLIASRPLLPVMDCVIRSTGVENVMAATSV